MSKRRIACRVALTARVDNRRIQAVSAQTLATKVFHLLLQPFPFGGRAARRRLMAHTEYPGVASEHPKARPCRAGVRLRLEGAATRRLAWRPASSETPFTTSSLTTNDEVSEATL